jgi:acyl carrier protein
MGEIEMDKDTVGEAINEIICASLALEPDEVTPERTLVDDLGMDSLDFLDIMFSLEKRFDAKIRDQKVDSFLRPNGGEDDLPAHFSDAEIESLAELMPTIKDAAATGPVSRNQVFSFVTVDTIQRIVSRKLSGG